MTCPPIQQLTYGGREWRVELRPGMAWGERVWRRGADNVWEPHTSLVRDGIVCRATIYRVRVRAREMQWIGE